MPTPQTVLIMGTGSTALSLARGLSSGPDKVLICDENPALAASIVAQLKTALPHLDIETLPCSFEACWEADLIFFTQTVKEQLSAAQKLRTVANQKTVVVTGDVHPSLETYLPNSKMVQLQFRKPEAGAEVSALTSCFLKGKDEEAVEVVAGMVRRMGFQPEYAGAAQSLENLNQLSSNNKHNQ
ncbi:MAG TPA: NAD(P)-binding domain-containing protein [Flavisolibacter sp.]|jgi:predicted dinucleotide-binding enzyme|nr:NAD(P)-binding domain-containing protein [Flavisolibacter sp.]